MDELGIYTDNIEGVTFGPILPNGHKILLFVSDNNFNAFEKTQLLLFELMDWTFGRTLSVYSYKNCYLVQWLQGFINFV